MPKKIRQRLGLAAGDELEVDYPASSITDFGEDAIVLRVVRPEVPLRREGNFWVYRGDDVSASVDVVGLLTAERGARSEAVLSGSTGLPGIEENAEP